MKIVKKLCSVCLALLMTVSVCPMGGVLSSADSTKSGTYLYEIYQNDMLFEQNIRLNFQAEVRQVLRLNANL